MMVSEIDGSWIDEIGPEGRLISAVKAPVSYPSDPQPLPGGRILLADYATPGHVLIVDRRGRVLWRYGPAQRPGELEPPVAGEHAAERRHRGQRRLQRPCGRDRPAHEQDRVAVRPQQPAGTAPGYLNTPDGMDFVPAGPKGLPDYAAVVHP